MKDALKVHYQSGILHEVEQETTSGVYTAEIILKDQILISKIQANAAAGTEGQKNAEPNHLELLPGAHSELSEERFCFDGAYHRISAFTTENDRRISFGKG